MRQLTAIRRVIFPVQHPDFALDDDQISHGARLWANLLSLMATAAWLEQKNRRIVELEEGTLAVEATPDDYETAYLIFNEVCRRTVVNLSDTHRRILDGLYDLMENNPERGGFTQGEMNTASPSNGEEESDEHVHGLFTEEMNSQSGIGMRNGAHKREAVQLFSEFMDVEDLSFLDEEEL